MTRHARLAVISGFLALTHIFPALAEPGGDDGIIPSVNPLKNVCSLVVTHDCGIVAGPSPEYPQLAEPSDATCIVSYQVKDDGTVTVLSASCDDERFADSAVKGMSSVRYKTRDVCDRVCRNVGRVFDVPIIYEASE